MYVGGVKSLFTFALCGVFVKFPVIAGSQHDAGAVFDQQNTAEVLSRGELCLLLLLVSVERTIGRGQ